VNGSRKVRVLKRDGTEEAFDPHKLAGAMFRAMRETEGRFYDAYQLAQALGMYLRRSRRRRISSAAIFEMAVKVLRRCRLGAAGEAMEAHRTERQVRRSRLHVCHDGDKLTLWDKNWLSQLAQRSWFLSPATGRILAAEIERSLLAARVTLVARQEVVDMLNGRVAEYGLADAVPVRLPAGG
jgi:hypothetical protein